MQHRNAIIIACSSSHFARSIADKIRLEISVPVFISLNDTELTTMIHKNKSSLILIEENFHKNLTSYIIGTLQEKYQHIRFAIFTFRDLAPPEVAGFLYTASSIINFRLDPEECMRGISLILTGRDYVPPNIGNALEKLNIEPLENISLTKRETMILILLSDGKNTNDIGSILGISQGTVKNHKKKVYKKCCVNNQFDLIIFANTLKQYKAEKILPVYDEIRTAVLTAPET